MNAEVIDEITEGVAKCYLIRVKLTDYITSLPGDYRDYEVQREIVNNSYLDNLIQTILERRHIPQMVLVAEDSTLQPHNGNIKIGAFKVLDGLQRTYRLKVIYDTIQLAISELKASPNIVDLSRSQLSREYREQLREIKSSAILFEKLLNYFSENAYEDPIALNQLLDRSQWFELWVGLEPPDEVNKMLILNAGHKAVKNQHQLELLFSNMLPLFKNMNHVGFEVIRERDTSTIAYSKHRVAGQFHFSHLITSVLSFNAGKPITNNVNLIQKANSDDFDDTIFEKLISYNFIEQFISTLMLLDDELSKVYGDVAIRWLGRETSLTGLFAACGKYSKERDLIPVVALTELTQKITANPHALNLKNFEEIRNSLNLSKVNIGNVNKKAVFDASFDLLSGYSDFIIWQSYFNKAV
ncbi:hypothetical protein [Pedobacter psychroterrae]|uniref:DUF262 domain-containing protein n=1 Tax=Pedobacter psychroterrae TaxID=2530453 RepID=A0A4R0NQ85_9SPHI|nr:hypothetical protein [Pedobacter psychroterrae]TCD03202.1 hypothetical protein EZ437_04310 [Pedobacter psychroterrae]